MAELETKLVEIKREMVECEELVTRTMIDMTELRMLANPTLNPPGT